MPTKNGYLQETFSKNGSRLEQPHRWVLLKISWGLAADCSCLTSVGERISKVERLGRWFLTFVEVKVGTHIYIYHIYIYIYIDRCISSFLSEGHNLMQKSSSLMLSGNRRVTWLESDLQLLFVTGKTLFKITMNSVDTTRKGFHTTIRISFRIERIGFFFWQRRGNIWNKSPDSGAMGCWWLVHFHFLQCPLIHSSFMGAEVSKAD